MKIEELLHLISVRLHDNNELLRQIKRSTVEQHRIIIKIQKQFVKKPVSKPVKCC